MGELSSFRDLKVYQKLKALHLEVHTESLGFPKLRDLYELGSQVRRSSNCAPALLAGRMGKPTYEHLHRNDQPCHGRSPGELNITLTLRRTRSTSQINGLGSSMPATTNAVACSKDCTRLTVSGAGPREPEDEGAVFQVRSICTLTASFLAQASVNAALASRNGKTRLMSGRRSTRLLATRRIASSKTGP